jgi:uncharacterized protein (TIGR03000 family)
VDGLRPHVRPSVRLANEARLRSGFFVSRYPYRWVARGGYLYPLYEDTYAPPTTSYYPVPSEEESYEGGPQGYGLPPEETAPAGRALVVVVLPDPEAEVWFNDYKVKAAGARRTFTTPPLDPEQDYHYTVVAVWREGTRQVRDERTVDVRAGQTTVIDFTRPADTRRMPPAAPE